jgi:hypothetical protein
MNSIDLFPFSKITIPTTTGWRRVVLFGLYFNPAAIVIKDG